MGPSSFLISPETKTWIQKNLYFSRLRCYIVKNPDKSLKSSTLIAPLRACFNVSIRYHRLLSFITEASSGMEIA